MAKYANVIVDISIEKLDRPFQYRIPPELEEAVTEGTQVDITFGKRALTGYVIELTDQPELEPERIKPIQGIHEGSVAIESQLIRLAAWMRENYGSTMNQALKTVLPVKRKMKEVTRKTILLNVSEAEARRQLALLESKHARARARLLRELIEETQLDYRLVTEKLGVSAASIRGLQEKGIITLYTETDYRNPVSSIAKKGVVHKLNEEQQRVTEQILTDLRQGKRETYLLKGVTGSGKTEVYMELIAETLKAGRQAIVLIPEIALTFQTVMRFCNRFGSRVSIINSRLSPGERYDQFQRAKEGDVDIMIGPRSALFTPFARLGLIIIDEEHESSYKSETVPRYHARETAIFRAQMCGASVLLGSATPSVYSAYMAETGAYKLLEMKNRAGSQSLPNCEVVDLRQELKKGNRSILSLRLQEQMEKRLADGQQTMLFINRRGVAGFMSCRSCGHVIKCPHCDVSLSRHNNGRMICHYCGYEEAVPVKCPSCGSGYIGSFKAGTQKIEEIVQKRFPDAKILRMDYDTTREKDSYEKILQAFANQEADILIGTQMIVKGHDFPNVTLVGVLAADLSLNVNDFHGPERTFQLITQAAGRAGRGDLPGDVVIQTYAPEHYAIRTACTQSYEDFYRQEIAFRRMLSYPPVWNMLVIFCTSPKEEELEQGVRLMGDRLKALIDRREESLRRHLQLPDTARFLPAEKRLQMNGPVDASIQKVNDVYRKVIYLKTMDYELLVACKDRMEKFTRDHTAFKNIMVQYDFNPVSGF